MLLLNQAQSQSTHSVMSGVDTPYVAERFAQYIARKNYTLQDVCRLCERSPRTVRKWLAHNPPGWVYIHLNTNAS